MLPLDDPRWSTLTHAYGLAGDMPGQLSKLAEAMAAPQRAPQAEPWFTLWSSLCHQGDAYTASYAALPHIVHFAVNAQNPIDFNFFLLPVCIEIARANDKGPRVPVFLQAGYEDGIALLKDAVCVHRADHWGQDMVISASAALSVANGHHRLAQALVNLDDDLIGKLVDLTLLG